MLILLKFGSHITLEKVFTSFIPIISRKYWFITCYFVLVLLSPFLNAIPEKLDQKSFERLLILLLVIFSFIPTFFYYEITKDGGRGIVNFLLAYLIGRYIRLYINDIYTKKRLGFIILLIILFTFGLEILQWSIFAGNKGLIFSRDLSVFMILLAISFFLFFRQLNFQSKFVNYISKSVLSVYILEGFVRGVIGHFFSIQNYLSEWYLCIVLLFFSVLVVSICIGIDIVFRITCSKFEFFLVEKEVRFLGYMRLKLDFLTRISNILKNE
jgi:hypothetical protein